VHAIFGQFLTRPDPLRTHFFSLFFTFRPPAAHFFSCSDKKTRVPDKKIRVPDKKICVPNKKLRPNRVAHDVDDDVGWVPYVIARCDQILSVDAIGDTF